MIRNLKALGLALVAVFAMSAMTASAASATDFFTTANQEPAYLTGSSHDNIFNIPGGSSFQCTTSAFDGTGVHGGSTVTVLPTYSGILNETPHTNPKCTASLGTVTIDVNHCHYVLTGNTTGSDNGTDATVSIVCGAAGPIKITGPLGCTVSVPSQTPTSGGVVYDNETNHPGGSAIKVTATSTGITFTSTAACGFVGIPSHGNNATYVGSVIATGYTDNVNNSTTNLTTIHEGPQVGVSIS
ncbi:MAG TPA: hypothetical protein VIS95_05240 [Solirubrobacterales bacterium]